MTRQPKKPIIEFIIQRRKTPSLFTVTKIQKTSIEIYQVRYRNKKGKLTKFHKGIYLKPELWARKKVQNLNTLKMEWKFFKIKKEYGKFELQKLKKPITIKSIRKKIVKDIHKRDKMFTTRIFEGILRIHYREEVLV